MRRESGKFYCFSSGIGGSVITFAQRYFNISSHEAIERLKAYAGVKDDIALPNEKMSATLTCKKFARQNKPKKENKTTVLPKDYMDRYEDNPEKLSAWRDKGISDEAMKKFIY